MRVQRSERGRGGGVPRRTHSFPRDREARRGRARRRRRRAGARARRARRSRRGGTAPRAAKVGTGLSLFIAILGLALLILVHEAGHFFASLAVGLRPRRFYVGFPPAIVKTIAEGHRVRDRRDPARRLRDDPRHAPPDPARRGAAVLARRRGRADARRPCRPREAHARRRRPRPRVSTRSTISRTRFAWPTVSPAARASAEKGLTELRDALGPDAYWKAATWRRLVAIGAGPAANILLAIVIFTFLFMTVAGQATRVVASVAPELEAGVASPAQTIGLQAGDRIVAINGQHGAGGRDRRHDRRVRGQEADAHRRPRRGRAPTRAGRRADSSTTATGSASVSKAVASASSRRSAAPWR